jgi:putative ABC transport system substrate-binding protein
VFRVGLLRSTGTPRTAAYTHSLIRQALDKLGYVEDRNLVVEARYAEGDPDRLLALAKELVESRVDVIVAIAHAAVRAAKNATSTIPIVMFTNTDPVSTGIIASLARPGGNVTGVLIAPEGALAAKKLELLKEAVPGARRIAVLAPDDPAALPLQLAELQRAAAVLKVELPVVEVRNKDYGDAFVRIAANQPQALFVFASSYFMLDRKPIIDLTTKYRLPSMWEWSEQVEDGGLMSYGSSLVERAQRIAGHVNLILKGRSPAEIPVEQPMTFELAINMKTTKALGIKIPQTILLRADRMIQ